MHTIQYNKPHIFKSADGEWIARVVRLNNFGHTTTIQRKGILPFSAYYKVVMAWAEVSLDGCLHRDKYIFKSK